MSTTNKPKYLIIHHSGGIISNPNFDSSWLTFEQINENHRQRWNFKSEMGFFCGYHFVIEKNGKTAQARLQTEEGAHCQHFNAQSIGICVVGNFNLTMPTKEQEESLRKLLIELVKKWQIPIGNVVPHRRFSKTDCYGLLLKDDWAQKLASRELLKSDKKEDIELLKKKISVLQRIVEVYIKLLNILKIAKDRDD